MSFSVWFLLVVMAQVRRLYVKQKGRNCQSSLEAEGGEEEDMARYHLHICSKNNFPTAAGLASSAAGYACLGRQGCGSGGAGVGQGWGGWGVGGRGGAGRWWEGLSLQVKRISGVLYVHRVVVFYRVLIASCSINAAVVCSVQSLHWPSCMGLRGTSLPLQGNSRHYHTCCTVQLLLHCTQTLYMT